MMVDCRLYNIQSIGNEERVKLLEHVLEKGVKPEDLGVSSTYIRLIRRGLRRVSDDLLCRVMALLSHEEVAEALGLRPRVGDVSIADVIRVVERAVVDEGFREVLINYLERYLGEYIRGTARRWVVTEGDLEEYVKAMRLRGRKERTIRDRVYYIRKALAEMDWVLSPEGINEYLYEVLNEEGPNVARHISASLKSFLKQVLRPRDPYLFGLLYNSFTTIQSKPNNRTRLPSIDELRQVLARLPSIEAKAYFLILAEDGLRPGEPFLVTMDDVDLEHGMLRIGKLEATKRAFIAFLRPETLEFIKTQYLPRREAFMKLVVSGIKASGWFGDDVVERFRNRFMPFDQGRLRREIKETAKQVLGRELELYELRKFFATWMISHGVPESIVNTLQGRAPPSEYRVLIEHYWSPRHEELRKWYLEHAPCLLCQ